MVPLTLFFLIHLNSLPNVSCLTAYPTFNGTYHSSFLTYMLGYQTLELTSSTIDRFNLEALPWNATGLLGSNITYLCSTYPILGGFNLSTPKAYYERNYASLPIHTILSFQLRFIIIDNWQPQDIITIQFGDRNVSVFNISLAKPYFSSSKLCGQQSYNDQRFVSIVGRIAHSDTTLRLRVYSNLTHNTSVASFGFRSMSLFYSLTQQTLPTSQAVLDYQMVPCMAIVESANVPKALIKIL